MYVRWPAPIHHRLLKFFARLYQINLNEAEKPLLEYPSIGDFFVRRLKDGARPLGSGVLVHPADAVLTQFSRLHQDQLIQAKGKDYSLAKLIGEPSTSQAVINFWQGSFAVYYLCPTDYHRVHSPVDGDILQVKWIPGHLWPVNRISVDSVRDLFAINERIVVEIQTAKGRCLVIFVGATNVGKMTLSFEPRVVTNNLKQREPLVFQYKNPRRIEKGAELGQFQMGSTVVMICDENLSQSWPLNETSKFLNKSTQVRAGWQN